MRKLGEKVTSAEMFNEAKDRAQKQHNSELKNLVTHRGGMLKLLQFHS